MVGVIAGAGICQERIKRTQVIAAQQVDGFGFDLRESAKGEQNQQGYSGRKTQPRTLHRLQLTAALADSKEILVHLSAFVATCAFNSTNCDLSFNFFHLLSSFLMRLAVAG